MPGEKGESEGGGAFRGLRLLEKENPVEGIPFSGKQQEQNQTLIRQLDHSSEKGTAPGIKRKRGSI